jgi:L-seryl-tRNA(Ser) seleniumtransferase
MTDIYAQLGVKRRINAAGTLTRLGGSLMGPFVLEAMREAAGASVDIAELQAAASRVIAGATGAEAGIVTSGAAAALTLATAACLARWDAARMDRLPDTSGMPNRVLMLRTHRNAYDHAIRAAGAEIVDLGHNDRGTGAGVRGIEAWEIDAAIDERTAAFAFTASPESRAALPMVVEAMHRRGLPVIVDAAAQLPPKENLRASFAMGADLVLFSGGKAIGGPQSSGILAGRRDLVGSALVQMMDMDVAPETWSPPDLINRNALTGVPHHGIGRGFKVGKEEIVGLLTALARFIESDDRSANAQLMTRLTAIAGKLVGAGLRAEVVPVERTGRVPIVELIVPGSAYEASAKLQAGDPPIHVSEKRAAAGILIIDPQALLPADDAILAERIVAACS